MEESEIKEIFSKNLIKLRKAKKMTQLQLADKLCFSDKAVSKWECGDTLPDIETFTRIASFFGITVNDLLSKQTNILQKILTKNIAITLLGFFLVWLATCVVYYFLNIFTNFDDLPTVIVCALPLSFIVLVVFSCIWFDKIWQFVSVSLLIWSLAFALFFLIDVGKWFVFIIAIVLEIMSIIWFWYRKLLTHTYKKKEK